MRRIYPRKTIYPQTKCCAVCQKKVNIKHFALLGSGQRHSYCRPCLSEYMRQRYHYLKKRAVTTLKQLL